MAISVATRTRLRLILQSIPNADEIIDALDSANNGQILINRYINEPVTIPNNYVLLQRNPMIGPAGHIIIQPGGELKVL